MKRNQADSPPLPPLHLRPRAKRKAVFRGLCDKIGVDPAKYVQ